jgi:ABC-type oligopeptide transport system substrate-binding subunit
MRQPVPFVPKLVSHQFFRPVPRKTVEQYGDKWTQPGRNRRQRRLHHRDLASVRRAHHEAQPQYYDAALVKLETLISYPIEDITTMMNLYKAGEVDATYNHTVPSSWIPLVRQYKDYQDTPEVATESYVFNTKSGPTRDVRVRHALNMAIDKEALARFRRAAKPTTSTVPVGMFPGYPSPQATRSTPKKRRPFWPKRATRTPPASTTHRPFPPLNLNSRTNTSESNRSNAEIIQSQWKQNLGITVRLRNMEFRTFLQTRSRLEYRGLARSGWIGDYMDPFTFLSMYVIEGGENGSGWSDPKFERLLSDANKQHDPDVRLPDAGRSRGAAPASPADDAALQQRHQLREEAFRQRHVCESVTMHPWKFVYIEHDPRSGTRAAPWANSSFGASWSFFRCSSSSSR